MLDLLRDKARIIQILAIAPSALAVIILLVLIGYGGGKVCAQAEQNWRNTMIANAGV